MTAALLVNPLSGGNRGKGNRLVQELAGSAGLQIRVLHSFEQIEKYLHEFSLLGVTDLFISSGDGTIQAVQTLLAENRIFDNLPRLCLLPHGTTNMTASDVGFRSSSIAAQAEFINRRCVNEVVRRPTLKIVNPRDGRPRHGMFLGTGAVTEAVRYCQESIHGLGLSGNLANFATLAATVAGSLASLSREARARAIMRPYDIRVATKEGPVVQGSQLLLLLTTLDRLVLGARPFWGGKSAPIRVTTFPFPVPSIIRWLLPSMYGSEHRRPPPGASSFACHSCSIVSSNSFVLDGEFVEAPVSESLIVETGPEFIYIRA
jgi:diacylglycerol kinase family enzyme